MNNTENKLKGILEEKQLFKSNLNREEANIAVEILRNEIRDVALDLYVNKIEEISRVQENMGKISYNPRHIIKALTENGILSHSLNKQFQKLDDIDFYNFIFSKVDDHEKELTRLLNKATNITQKIE